MSVHTAPSPQDSLALQQVWRTIHAESCPYDYNFHLHTVSSDGQLQPRELIAQAVKIGLKGLAITDHHSLQGYEIAQDWLQKQSDKRLPHLWTGVEVTSNLFGTEVHILGYAFDPNHPCMSLYLQGNRPEDNSASQVISAIHEARGLVVLAHPERYRRSAKELIPLAVELGVDGVETYYAYGNPKPWKTSIKQTQQVKELSEKYGLFNTCGTDTHGSNLLYRI